MNSVASIETIAGKIYAIRGVRIMLDRDLALLYGVETRALKQAVRRNAKRFPRDFMFEFTEEELRIWRSQFVISKGDRKGLRHRPMAFTEQGVAMLSSVLKSERAIEVNIQIMRAFVALRDTLGTHKDLARKLKELEEHLKDHDERIQVVFEAIKQLISKPESPRKSIGFQVKEKGNFYKTKKNVHKSKN